MGRIVYKSTVGFDKTTLQAFQVITTLEIADSTEREVSKFTGTAMTVHTIKNEPAEWITHAPIDWNGIGYSVYDLWGYYDKVGFDELKTWPRKVTAYKPGSLSFSNDVGIHFFYDKQKAEEWMDIIKPYSGSYPNGYLPYGAYGLLAIRKYVSEVRKEYINLIEGLLGGSL